QIVAGLGAKSVARRSDPHERLSVLQMIADKCHHLARRRPASDADEQKVGAFDNRVIREIIVASGGAGVDERASQAAGCQLALGELWQRFPGVVFVLAYQENDVARVSSGKSFGDRTR